MIVSYLGAATIHVAYTEIKNVHCGFHIERVTNLDVHHVNDTQNSYGMMLYGSLDQGMRTIDTSNIDGELAWAIDEEDGAINGPIAITNCYIANDTIGDVYLEAGTHITVSSPAAAAFTDAKPRVSQPRRPGTTLGATDCAPFSARGAAPDRRDLPRSAPRAGRAEVLAVGSDFREGTLLEAYAHGTFPGPTRAAPCRGARC